MEKSNIIILPEVRFFLAELAMELLAEDYFSFLGSAELMVNDIVDFIYQLPTVAHFELPPKAEKHFSKYGKNLQYAFFKRTSSRQTTWYVFFMRKEGRYIVCYITNNHKEGAYIR